MKNEIEKAKTPEEQELNDKVSELNSLETELAQKELDLATVMAELQALDSRYLRIVGAKFVELDNIKAEIAEILASQQPENVSAQEEAKQARERADQTARDTGDVSEPKKVEAFKPTKEIKELYRDIAKKIHPDLAIDEQDRERRTKIMAEVNQAYREGDYERLETILREWETSPEAIEGDDVGSKLVFEAAQNGDEAACEVFKRAGHALGIFLTIIVQCLVPRRIVIGGGIAQSGEMLFGPAREVVRKRVFPAEFRDEVEIVGAELGDLSGVYGSAVMVFQDVRIQPLFSPLNSKR